LFTPQPEAVREALFSTFLSIFLSREEGEAGQNTQASSTIERPKVRMPRFANELTLLTALEDRTQQVLNRTKPCTSELRTRLERYILSDDNIWNLDVVDEEDFPITPESGVWNWIIPPGGKFSTCRFVQQGEETFWEPFEDSYVDTLHNKTLR
jgi:hypothetical protein